MIEDADERAWRHAVRLGDIRAIDPRMPPLQACNAAGRKIYGRLRVLGRESRLFRHEQML
jgi:hypothetical protein